MAQIGLQDADGNVVDKVIPRKCCATNRLIGPKDFASVQLKIAKLDKDGKYKGEFEQLAFCGDLRHQGILDAQLTAIAQEKGLITDFE